MKREAKKQRSKEAKMFRIRGCKNWLFLCFFFASVHLCIFASFVFASEYDDAKNLIQSGQVEAGAQMLARMVGAKSSPEALLLLGKALDRLQDLFSERAEKICYWAKGGGGSPACMQAEAAKLNATYGANAFKSVTDIAYVPYTGVHYQELLSKFPKSSQAAEAEFQLLLKNLMGHPDVVLPKVKDYLNRHSSGEVNRKALLLWARVNQDVWYIHREWSWVLYNEKVSLDDLIVRAEPYRQEALKTFEKLMNKYSGTFEGDAAKQEYDLLKANQHDNETYSILADTVGGSPDKWGSTIPKPALSATQRGVGEQDRKAGAPAPSKQAAPVVSAPAPTTEPTSEKKHEVPQRWK